MDFMWILFLRSCVYVQKWVKGWPVMYVADYEREILRNLSGGKRMIIPFTDGNFLVNRRKQSFHSMHDWRSTDE